LNFKSGDGKINSNFTQFSVHQRNATGNFILFFGVGFYGWIYPVFFRLRIKTFSGFLLMITPFYTPTVHTGL